MQRSPNWTNLQSTAKNLRRRWESSWCRPNFSLILSPWRHCAGAGCTTQEIDLDLPQRRMEAYAAGHHLSCIDLLPYLRASKSLPYCRHSRQWNETGNAIVANAVSQFIMTRYGNQMAASSASR